MKRYSQEQKAAALHVIAARGVSEASVETGIPERTLYTWQKLHKRTQPEAPPLPPPYAAHNPEDAEDLRFDTIMDKVLAQLMEQAQVLSARFSQNYDKMPPTSQMMALTRLIDRIIKLDARKPRTGKELRVRVIRVDKGEKEPDDWR